MRQLVTKYQPPGVINKAGEVFIDEVTGQIKIGDGSTVNGVSKGNTNVGTYNTLSDLTSANSIGVLGDFGYVGTVAPFTRYEFDGSGWHESAILADGDEPAVFRNNNFGVNIVSRVDGSTQYTIKTTEYYGIKHDGTDESAKVQAALNDLDSIGQGHGGTLQFPDGKSTVCTNIIWPRAITLASESGYAMFSENASEWSGHLLTQPTVSSTPILRNDPTVGYIRQTGLNGQPQRYHGGQLKGLTLTGSRNVGLHTADADLVRLQNVWNVTMMYCMFLSSRGFGVRGLDLNVLRMGGCNGLMSPMFFQSLADSQIYDGQFGGGNGLASTPFWLAHQSQKNVFRGNLIFNNQQNGTPGIVTRGYGFPMVVSSINTTSGVITFATNSITGDAAHKWTSGTPITVSSTGAMPGGISTSQTYYVVYQTASSILLADTYTDSSTYHVVVPSSAGTGTITMEVGKSANLYVNHASTLNTFSGGRLDQAFGHALLVDGSTANSFSDMTVKEGSFGNYSGTVQAGYPVAHIPPVPGAAIRFANGSINNTLGGSWTIDGAKTGTLNQTTGYESRQKFGVSCDSTSSVIVPVTVASFNHTAANSEAGAADWEQSHLSPHRVVVDSNTFANRTGATLGTFGGGRRTGWNMPVSIDATVSTKIQIPNYWSNIVMKLYFVGNVTATGNVAWIVQAAPFDTADTTAVADTLQTAILYTPVTTQDVLVQTTFAPLNVTSANNKTLFISVKHVGTDVLNTYTGGVTLSHIVIERA